MSSETQLAETLGPIEVFAPDGSKVRLGTLWADRACVLVFVRHFG
jgi:hypothetical protein